MTSTFDFLPQNKVHVLHVRLTELHAAHQNLPTAIRTLRIKETIQNIHRKRTKSDNNFVVRNIMSHRAKFHKNRLNRSRDMVIFILFKMAATAILNFRNLNFLTVGTVKKMELHRCAKFYRNR